MFEYGLIIGDVGDGMLVPLALVVLLVLACAAVGYFLGGVNSAIIISGVFYHSDIRKYGSYNAGMTNMMRTYGKAAAAGTLAGDLLKTVIAVLIGRVLFGNNGAYIAGCASVIGHIYPCYFGFKGGKGVVSVAAMILCTDPMCCLILFILFAVIVAAYRYISLGSVMCMLLYPLLSNRLGTVESIPTICTFIVACVIIYKHKENIKRLLNRTENKFSFKKSVKPPQSDDSKGSDTDD